MPMRLLVLTTSFPSSTYPHSGVFVRRMLERLPADIEITVLTPSPDQPRSLGEDNDRIRVYGFRYAPRVWQTLAHRPGGIPVALRNKTWQWALVPFFCMAMFWQTLCHARRADLIHAHWSVCGVIAGLAGKLTGTPVVTTLRGSDVTLAKDSYLFRRAIQWCGAMSQAIVTVSQAMVDAVGRWILKARTKIEAIPNGVGEEFGAAPRSIAPGFTVGVIGNLVQSKQVDGAIRSFAGLDNGPPMARLLVVGDGPERAALEVLAQRLGLGSRALFTGALPPEEIPGVLAQCHTMVLASRSEGRPNVVLEAMAAGVPVVASDIDGVRELIVHGERGLLFPVGDEQRLAAHLRSLMDDPALGLRLVANARQWLDDQGLTWENTARRYADIYRQILRRQVIRRQVLRQRRDRN